MRELLYDVNGVGIAIALLAAVALAIEIGFRLGLRRGDFTESYREHLNVVQATILGILALLLGFTFEISLNRFDGRSEAVVRESNSIAMTYTRSRLLAPALQEEAQKLLSSYVDLRVQDGRLGLDKSQHRADLREQVEHVRASLWDVARRSFQGGDGSRGAFLFVEALGQTATALSEREDVLDRHIPEVVLLLLFAAFLASGLIVGFVSGASRFRPSRMSYVMATMIAFLLFVVMDMDRPRRGLINVSQHSMEEVQALIRSGASSAMR